MRQKKLLVLIGTFFNIGKFPIAQGTLTSLITMLIFYFVNILLHTSCFTQIIAIIIIFFLGIPASSAGEKYFKKKDPGEIVIDEVAGQMIALLFIPLTLAYYFAGFLLFRIFDIFKPFPIGLIDKKMHGGLGIMLDDVLAGLYALACLHIIIYLI